MKTAAAVAVQQIINEFVNKQSFYFVLNTRQLMNEERAEFAEWRTIGCLSLY
jgi:hypothetical protein